MSAILGVGDWGWGCARSAPDSHRGAGNDTLTDERYADLMGRSAKEAVESLTGEFADGNMPAVDDFTFPGPIAEAFYWSNADIVGIQGPVGSGKTTTLMKSRLRRAIEMPQSTVDGVRRYKVLFIRETYRQLWATSIPSYLETYPKSLGTWSGGRGDPVQHKILFEDDFGPIEWVAEFMAFGDDVVASMRGIQATDIVMNEMDTMPVEVFSVGIGRIDRWPGREHFAGLPDELRSYGQIVGDFNAPDEETFVFTLFHDEEAQQDTIGSLTQDDEREIKIEFFNQPGFGSPGCENLQNLGPDYYARQIKANRMAGRGDMIERLVYNKVTTLRVGEPVYLREFNRRIHVSNTTLQPIAGEPLRIGLDQGLKGAAVIAQFVAPFHWRFYAELHFPKERLLAKVFGERLRDLLDERFPGFRIEAGWGDMAGEHGSSTAADENDTWNRLVGKVADITIRPQRIGTNRIQPRLEALRAPLEYISGGEPGLILDPSMKFAIRGLEARYVWTDEVNASGDKRKIPDKSYTEANVIDAMQYLCLSEHRGDGLSPHSFGGRAGRRGPDQMGHNGGPPLNGAGQGGLRTDYDIMNPYGD